jgi:hypothetical protein
MAERFRRNTQQQLFDTSDMNMRAADPIPAIMGAAKRHTGGRYDPTDLEHTVAHGPQGYAMYKTFERGQSGPLSPEMHRSYEALRQHLGPQFEQLTAPRSEGGAGIDVQFTEENPYESFSEMHNDVSQNNRLKIWSTAAGGTSHGIMSDRENDMFRAVHDAYGHLGIGRNFDRHGEEAAYLSHAQMFPPEAHQALAAETRGQNSYLNWGGGGFPPNDPANIPEWMTKKDVRVPDEPRKKVDAEQLRLF